MYKRQVHDIEEMKRVNNLGAKIVGINNRNLKTFEEDLHTTERLTAGLENRSEKAVVSESGIKNNTDLRYLETLGIDAVLIGESFMRRQDCLLYTSRSSEYFEKRSICSSVVSIPSFLIPSINNSLFIVYPVPVIFIVFYQYSKSFS